MRVATRAVRDMARASGLPDEMIERNMEALTEYTLRIASRERKHNMDLIRKWYFSKNPAKGPLFDIFSDEDYDLI